jgi:hypothetical protein
MHPARRYALVAATALAALLILVALLLRHEPALLPRRGFPEGSGADGTAERLAARMVTNASALNAAVGREGAWDAVFTDAEVNAWLAVDLPRNHQSLLPAGVTSPRVRFRPRHVAVGARLGYGILSAVAWAELEVELRGNGQLRIAPACAGLGAIPLPGDFAVRKIADGIMPLGLLSELRRIDGRLVLFVSIPAADADGRVCRLESLRIDDGEMLLAGATSRLERPAAPR